MSTVPALIKAGETKWTILNGSMKGAVRLIKASTFTIGRNPDCEFVITNDPKCSRKHASVQATSAGFELLSLNEKNLTSVNGEEVRHALLQDGDHILIGETEILFNLTSVPQIAPYNPSIAPSPQEAPYPYPSSPHMPRHEGNRAIPLQKNKKSNRLFIYGAVALVLIWLFTSNSKTKKKEITLRTEQQIQADIETANKLRATSEALVAKKIAESPLTRQAQENYVRGFRDYRKGQFERALESFQACLALYPDHILCNRYIRLAQRRFSELVQYQIVLGRKYRDQNQFQACRAAYRNVMVMVKDTNSPAFKEAKANYDACNAMVEERY